MVTDSRRSFRQHIGTSGSLRLKDVPELAPMLPFLGEAASVRDAFETTGDGSVELSGRAYLFGAAAPFPVSVRVPTDERSGPQWVLAYTPDPGALSLGAGIGALEKLLPSDFGLDLSLPDALHLDDISLRSFTVGVLPDTGQVLFVDLAVALGTRWAVLDGFEIADVTVGVDILLPFDGRVITPWIAGTLELGVRRKARLDLRASAHGGSYFFRGTLREGDRVSLTDALATIAPGLSLPDIEVGALHVDLDTTGAFVVEASLQSDWELLGGLHIEAVWFQLMRTGGALVGAVGGQCRVAGVDVAVMGSQEGPGQGWLLSGMAGQQTPIPLGQLLEKAASQLGLDDASFPDALASFEIANLSLTLQTSSRDLTLRCDGLFPGSETLALSVDITLRRTNTGYRKTFSGRIVVGDLALAVVFSSAPGVGVLLADYRSTSPRPKKVAELASAISPSFGEMIPEDLEITLTEILLAGVRDAGATRYLLGVDLEGGLSLSGLPLVGPALGGMGALKLRFRPLIAQAPLSRDQIALVQAVVPEGGFRLPEAGLDSTFVLDVALDLGGQTIPLALPVAMGSSGQLQPAPGAAPSLPAGSPRGVTPQGDVKWIALQKSFGPLSIGRIGVGYAGGELSFLFDAALTAGPLTLSLLGLGASSKLSPLEPSFRLDGLGLDYRGGPLEIGGTFLRQTLLDDGKPYDAYSGRVVLKTESFALSALGSYASVSGHPSLFVYAFLDYPLGGPSFFFVTGLAVGFGFNRALRAPTLREVDTFPLVVEATGSLAPAPSLDGELRRMNEVITPSVGGLFLAAGIRFNSFKLIDSFALLAVSFGSRFEVDVLGLSTAVLPPPEAGSSVPRLAEVQMAVLARFVPDEGVLSVQAELTPASYLLSPDCRLTGGFAFFSWFSDDAERDIHAGDFVLTLGGYHPLYRPPRHYPSVPRLGFNWRVSPQLTIKGGGYLALTPSAFMAGGHLEATWKDGSLEADFTIGADLLIAWKPYHYDARIYVSMGISYTYELFGTHHLSVDASADLHVWGPPFSGRAKVYFAGFSATVSFGAKAPAAPKALDWPTFASSFLPERTQMCSVFPKAGLQRTLQSDKGDVWVIDPTTFCLSTDCAIPSKRLQSEGGELSLEGRNTSFGIGPMALQGDAFATSQSVRITREGEPVTGEFELTPLAKSVPAALWGQTLTPDLGGAGLVEGVVTGVDVRPKAPPVAGATHAISRSKLQFETFPVPQAFGWVAGQVPTSLERARLTIAQTLGDHEISKRRAALLAALGLDTEEPDLRPADVASSLLADPQVSGDAA
jgi:hypothetical protein